MKNIKKLLYDNSSWSLFLANAITIYLAINASWSVITILWVYWWQSVIIGIFQYYKMRRIEDVNSGKAIPGSSSGLFEKTLNNSQSSFFLFHYGFFHFVYAIFLGADFIDLVVGRSYQIPDIKNIIFSILLFSGNHFYSFRYNKPHQPESLDKLFIMPYARIIPMHLTIIFGAFFGQNIMYLFMFLKLIADQIMHSVEHSDGKFVQVKN